MMPVAPEVQSQVQLRSKVRLIPLASLLGAKARAWPIWTAIQVSDIFYRKWLGLLTLLVR